MDVMRGCRPSSGQIVNSFGQGKCTFNLKKTMIVAAMFEQAYIC